MKKVIVIPFLLFTALGQAVSRVGGGRIQSVESEFEMTLPQEYSSVEQMGPHQVLAKGPVFYMKSGGFIDLNLFISEFSQYFSGLRDLGQKDLVKELVKSEWALFQTSDPCIVGMKQARGSLASYLFTWGSGKGFIVNTPHVPVSDQTIEAMLQTLQLASGACSWK